MAGLDNEEVDAALINFWSHFAELHGWNAESFNLDASEFRHLHASIGGSQPLSALPYWSPCCCAPRGKPGPFPADETVESVNVAAPKVPFYTRPSDL